MTFDPARSMLPQSASNLVKALDILEERLLTLPVEMISKDPMRVDVGWLDHLAWEHSVDAWDSNWTEEIKRNVIAVSAEVHRYKGTPHAIITALRAFGVEAELIEWWEPVGSGVPGTFRARAFVTDPLDGGQELEVTAAIVSAMKSVLNSVSPVSRSWSLEIGVRASADLRCGAFAQVQMVATAISKFDPPPTVTAPASFAVVPYVQLKTTVITV